MITLSTASLYPFGLKRIFEIASMAGFDGVELMIRSKKDNAFWDTWDIDYLKKIESKFNLKINSVHVPFEFEDKPENFSDIQEIGKKLKVKSIVIHIPRIDQYDYIKWFDNYYKYENSNNYPQLLAENVHIKKDKPNPIVNSLDELNKLHSLCFDMAHAMRSDVDVLEFVSKLKNIKQFHVSNWNGVDDHLSILENKDFFKKTIKATNGNADMCVELCPKAFDDFKNLSEVEKVLRETIKFIKINL